MATVLSQYQEQQKKLLDKLPSGLTNPELLALQELNYRISVLQTMQVYCKTAPVSTDVNALSPFGAALRAQAGREARPSAGNGSGFAREGLQRSEPPFSEL